MYSIVIDYSNFKSFLSIDLSLVPGVRLVHQFELYKSKSNRVFTSVSALIFDDIFQLFTSRDKIFFPLGLFTVAKKHKESEDIISLAKYFGVTTRTLRRWKKDALNSVSFSCHPDHRITSYDFYEQFPDWTSFRVWRALS